MSLTAALNIAQSALSNTSRQTSTVARNVSEANNPDYSRRSAVLVSTPQGARVGEIRRAADEVLFRQGLSALSGWNGQSTLLSGTETLIAGVNGIDNASSPAKALGDLQSALDLYAATPADRNVAAGAVAAARQLVRSLNDGSAAIQSFRADTDRQIATAVETLNGLLTEFGDANKAVVKATVTGSDATDALDRRDAILKKISEFVPVSTIARQGNDVVLMTGSGATLFETSARQVGFQPTSGLGAGISGHAVTVDGVPLAGGNGGNTDGSGTLAALVQLRDTVAPTMQSQLDEVARGMIAAFAETDRTGSAQPPRTGLFTWPGGPALPPAGTVAAGLAGRIAINSAYDTATGGTVFALRDGGTNGAAYLANTAGAASYSALLLDYSDTIGQPMAFDPAAGLGAGASVAELSSSAIGWVESLRRQATEAETTKNALMTRTTDALANETGVNIDDQMSLLLELENSYAASARLLKTADDMLGALLAAVG